MLQPLGRFAAVPTTPRDVLVRILLREYYLLVVPWMMVLEADGRRTVLKFDPLL
jgi:hypothetical protein